MGDIGGLADGLLCYFEAGEDERQLILTRDEVMSIRAAATELTELRRVRDVANKVAQRGYFEDRYHFIVDGDLLRELRDALADQLANREGK